jgi:uncharacterized membrane protein
VASLEGITRLLPSFYGFLLIVIGILLPIFNRQLKKVLNGKNSVSDDIKGP